MDNYARAVPGTDLSGDPGHGGIQPMKALKGGCAAPNVAAPVGADGAVMNAQFGGGGEETGQ
ncbi:hypothetical protein ADL25_22285 [Streptomyces sp. NRRL F-5122]|uniref:hypothetical protein n=1 Tax=Streptomyces sp. NRRL F-5122 TaxID=1609098 RepID=UPI000741033E|nr:hypothetical protein [Streptomyces sp. NRRL F-5122]KUJ38965.1 hypothetical protein ADL25_22285 [Streptomyces sp. NRRL F-5122]